MSSLLQESQKTNTGLEKPEGSQLEEGKKLKLLPPSSCGVRALGFGLII